MKVLIQQSADMIEVMKENMLNQFEDVSINSTATQYKFFFYEDKYETHGSL